MWVCVCVWGVWGVCRGGRGVSQPKNTSAWFAKLHAIQFLQTPNPLKKPGFRKLAKPAQENTGMIPLGLLASKQERLANTNGSNSKPCCTSRVAFVQAVVGPNSVSTSLSSCWPEWECVKRNFPNADLFLVPNSSFHGALD